MDRVNQIYAWKAGKHGEREHSFLLPKDIRAIVCGGSGFGKTTLVTHLLLEPGLVDYSHLLVCGNSLHQPEYVVIEAALRKGLSKSQIKELFQRQNEVEESGGIDRVLSEYDGECGGGIEATFFSDITKLPDPKTHCTDRKTLLLLDDCMLDPQSSAEAYYARGRHNSVEVIYIAQSYFKLARQTVRENATIYFIFQQDQKNLQNIHRDLCAQDGISYEQFSRFCRDVWSESIHNFVTVDKTRSARFGKFRKCLADYWIPTDLAQDGGPVSARDES